MEEELICYEVETIYKTGRKKSEVIVSSSEENMWKCYNKKHNKIFIESSVITDCWLY